MINAAKLLADLKRLRKVLDADLRTVHAVGKNRDVVHDEWREAFDLGRTRDTFETFLESAFDQAVVHWVLGCVFLRFLEDNLLVDRPFLSGPSERLELAKERQDGHFRARPHDSDTEYLLAIFAEAAQLPGLAGLYDDVHNPLFRMPLSGDGAMALIRFFREVLPETGELTHDFTDPDWDTRFLGDLYQDLSEEARKRYALLQTPEFVEEWILDRTLEPAIREFGHERVTMIDPTCGSGHFLLGGFDRLLRDWRRFAPGLPSAEQAQRALDAVAGVDLNPFAVEIARFRLLLAALRAAGVEKMISAPAFRLHLAAGDSLLHGQHFFRMELGGIDEGFRRTVRHHYSAEDNAEIDRILGRQYHAVVGNPPYITPKDAAMRDAYREIYSSCYRTYGLGVPFTERFFDLALNSTLDRAAGFVGLIVANSFIKREFGAKLIEQVLPRLDLTHVVDCSGAYIPGHATPTVILFGRNRAPVDGKLRVVMGVSGEPFAPEDPAKGLVWSAIVAQVDLPGSASDFITVQDTPRRIFSVHPWSIGGGGAANVKEAIEAGAPLCLGEQCSGSIGGAVRIGADEAFMYDSVRLRNSFLPPSDFRVLMIGERVRDWSATSTEWVYYPYAGGSRDLAHREFWPLRTTLRERATFQGVMADAGLDWLEYMQHTAATYVTPLSITFAFVATHNHFVLDHGGKVFNRSAPVIKLPSEAGVDDHLGLLGLLNSSIACFWMKQVMSDKGNGGIGGGISNEPWERRYEIDGTKLRRFPITPTGRPVDLARALEVAAETLTQNLPAAVSMRVVPTRATLDSARSLAKAARESMIALQEELDWQCYRNYGLHSTSPEHSAPPPLQLGERAFEIVMARQMAAGTLETAWFIRHGSTPITEIPTHWPEDYRRVVEQRIAIIESDLTIGLLERPDFKRRWLMETWEEMEHAALRTWLLDRIEAAPDLEHWRPMPSFN
ncbi:BREX-2 system adenine-specific DNA-methyltransferase PglX [Bradyrhizobium sp. 168]|uniref:BREX-2 system adenine-specific DNA-methyltransferase PglX n=1 Tax=Bradyrhizobium sp. 168 TaxID=2782639 RepID=UPI001FFBB728|nr:BREX-2 system adenine-specific DNA-methyltransferase PglX [Bradyrhizobium sp. 168]MCK1578687.1 BREX-2 system adenine-specific DNA-methyltransferase PglX [Bradyrhizobium sp. 168]